MVIGGSFDSQEQRLLLTFTKGGENMVSNNFHAITTDSGDSATLISSGEVGCSTSSTVVRGPPVSFPLAVL